MEETNNVNEELTSASEQDTPTEPPEPVPAEDSPPVATADGGAEADVNEQQLTELYEESFHLFTEGELVEGKVISISESTVVVDIGYKSEGLIDVREFYDEEGKVPVEVGDKVEVLLEATENIDGSLVLSKDKAEKMKVWDDIEDAYKNDKVIDGRVIDRIKGGLAVDVGVRAFLPGSQVDVRPVRNLESMRGKEIRVKVIKLNKRRGNIVLSRKDVIEAENKDRKKETLKKLEQGAVLDGVVKNITEYGAFVDLGGIDGLLHITDMSWGRISHPSELFVVGDEVEVVVLKYDSETERVSLGYKQRTDDPWENVEEKFPVNTRMRGKIVSITDYGAFIELEAGVEGLIHVSEMSWSKRVKHPSKMVSVGEMVEAVVLDVDTAARRISLGLKQVEPNPWILVRERYREGDVIKGRVRNITDFGAFVEVEEGIDGLVHVSDMSWSKRVKHPSEVLKKGEEVEAIILNIDVDSQRLSLGLKQMTPNTWDEYFSSHSIGDVVDCTVVRITNFGLFVELDAEGIEGLIHASELDTSRERAPEELFSVGEKLKAMIIKMDRAENKIGLSVRALLEEETRKVKATLAKKPSGKATLADVIGEQALELFGGGKAEKEEASADAETPEAEAESTKAEAGIPEAEAETPEVVAEEETVKAEPGGDAESDAGEPEAAEEGGKLEKKKAPVEAEASEADAAAEEEAAEEKAAKERATKDEAAKAEAEGDAEPAVGEPEAAEEGSSSEGEDSEDTEEKGEES